MLQKCWHAEMSTYILLLRCCQADSTASGPPVLLVLNRGLASSFFFQILNEISRPRTASLWQCRLHNKPRRFVLLFEGGLSPLPSPFIFYCQRAYSSGKEASQKKSSWPAMHTFICWAQTLQHSHLVLLNRDLTALPQELFIKS